MRQLAIAFLFLGSLTAFTGTSFADTSFPPAVGTAGSDLTAHFLSLQGKSGNTSFSAQDLKKYEIVFIPGFMADYTPNSFQAQMTELQNFGLTQGVDFIRVNHQNGFSGETSTAVNAKAILNAIAPITRPIIIISHSKGTLDFLTLLIDHPELRSQIKGWFSVQGAVAGTPIADSIVSRHWSTDVMDLVSRVVGGDLSGIDAMQTAPCLDYLNQHLSDIQDITSQIPTISFGTWVDPSELKFDLKLLYKFFGANMPLDANDGVVPTTSSMIPFTDFVVTHGPSHVQATESGTKDSMGFNRVQLMDTMLTMLQEKMGGF